MEDTIVTDKGKRKRKATDRDNNSKKRSRNEQETSKLVHPVSKDQKITLKKDDMIQMKMSDNEEWLGATVIDRSKVTGKYYNYFNVLGEDGLERNVDLERVAFRRVTEEEVNMVMVPRERHNDEECKKAKLVELIKLEEFGSFKAVKDVGQFRISCTWVCWYKGEEMRARLVARGFEEPEEVPSDSPTVDKCNIRILLLVAASMGWTIESSDVKSVFFCREENWREKSL